MINEGLVRGYFGMVTPGTKFSNFDELFARGEKTGSVLRQLRSKSLLRRLAWILNASRLQLRA